MESILYLTVVGGIQKNIPSSKVPVDVPLFGQIAHSTGYLFAEVQQWIPQKIPVGTIHHIYNINTISLLILPFIWHTYIAVHTQASASVNVPSGFLHPNIP